MIFIGESHKKKGGTERALLFYDSTQVGRVCRKVNVLTLDVRIVVTVITSIIYRKRRGKEFRFPLELKINLCVLCHTSIQRSALFVCARQHKHMRSLIRSPLSETPDEGAF